MRYLILSHPPHGPAMNWHIPRAPEHIDIRCVPPIAVKVTICEFENLAQHVEIGMETEIEPDKPQ